MNSYPTYLKAKQDIRKKYALTNLLFTSVNLKKNHTALKLFTYELCIYKGIILNEKLPMKNLRILKPCINIRI